MLVGALVVWSGVVVNAIASFLQVRCSRDLCDTRNEFEAARGWLGLGPAQWRRGYFR